MAKEVVVYYDGEIYSANTTVPCMEILDDFPNFRSFEKTSDYDFKCEYDGFTYTINGYEITEDIYKIDSCERAFIDGQDSSGNDIVYQSQRIEFSYDENGDLTSTRIIDFDVDRLPPFITTEYDTEGRAVEIKEGYSADSSFSEARYEYLGNGIKVEGHEGASTNNWEVHYYDYEDSQNATGTIIHEYERVNFDGPDVFFSDTKDVFTLYEGEVISVRRITEIPNADGTTDRQIAEYSVSEDGSWKCVVTTEFQDGVTEVEAEKYVSADYVPSINTDSMPESIREYLAEFDKDTWCDEHDVDKYYDDRCQGDPWDGTDDTWDDSDNSDGSDATWDTGDSDGDGYGF